MRYCPALAQKILPIELDRQGPPLFFEIEGTFVRRRPTEIKFFESAVDSKLDRLPIQHVIRTERLIFANRRRPRYFEHISEPESYTSCNHFFLIINSQNPSAIGKGRQNALKEILCVDRRAKVPHITSKHFIKPVQKLCLPDDEFQTAFLRLAYLISQLRIKALPLSLFVASELENHRYFVLL